MQTRTDFVNRIEVMKRTIISFNPTYGKYLINGLWTDEITHEYYEGILDDFFEDIAGYLQFLKSPKAFLEELYDLVWMKVEWYERKDMHKFEFYEDISSSIKEVLAIDHKPKKEKYSIAFIRQFDYDNAEELDEVVYTLKQYEIDANYYNDPLDFERVKLIHALRIHYKFLIELHGFLYTLEMDLDTLDLSKIHIERFKSKPSLLPKCTLKFDKITTAIFFGILMEKGILSMDENGKDNKVTIQRFVEAHFNYTSERGESTPITRINKELSKFKKFQHHIKELEITNNIIKIFTDHREEILSKYKKSHEDPLK